MSAFEQYPYTYHSRFTFDQDQEERKGLPYTANTLGTHATFETIPVTSEMFSTGQQEYNYGLMRPISQNSMHHSHAEAVPSLLSSTYAPSIPSASSSTVGSPYSGHAQLAPNPFLYNNQFITGPAIICDDSFAYGYESAHFDHEATIGQSAKLTAPFVGKCADLPSSVHRSTAILVQECLPSVPLVSSPKPISAAAEATTTLSSADAAGARVTSTATISKFHGRPSNAVFKSPSTPASVYPKTSSPDARRMSPPSAETQKDPFHFSYSCPFSLESSMPQHCSKAQYNLLSQANGNCLPLVETSCPSLLFSAFHDSCYA